MAEEQIARYRILDQIAAGSQGIVYRAFDPNSNRVVAIKVLHQNFAADETYVRRFQREATIAASIDHPNIVRIFEVGEDDGRHFMVMEHLPESVDNLIRAGLPTESASRLAAQIADGLQVAHEAGIVHRDIKPQNILIGPDGMPKVTDFGIARSELMSVMTATGVLMGTPYYMSPEQARGDNPDLRSDVYSLGCLFYQLLTGALPFSASTPLVVLRRQIEDDPLPLRELREDIPDGIVRIVERAMRKVPEERFQSMADMASAIRNLVVMEPSANGGIRESESSDRATDRLPPETPLRGTEPESWVEADRESNAELAKLAQEVAQLRAEVGRKDDSLTSRPVASGYRRYQPSPITHITGTDQHIGLFRQFVGLSGRINRRGYIGRMCLMQVPIYIGGVLGGTSEDLEGFDVVDLGATVSLVGFLGLVIVAYCAGIRRFHDLGWSGWRFFLVLIPFASFFLAGLMLFRKGEETTNYYGPKPRGWSVGLDDR